MGLTVIMVFGLSLFAIQTKYDFTKLGGALFTAALLFFVASMIGVFCRVKIIRLILAYFGVTLFSVFLICKIIFFLNRRTFIEFKNGNFIFFIDDIQQVVGGREDQLDPEEYIAGALQIYIDIMAIFRYLLRIVGATSND